MASINITTTTRDAGVRHTLDRLLEALRPPGITDLTEAGADAIKTAVILHAPERSGALKRSVDYRPNGPASWRIGPDTAAIPYAVIQDRGGVIRPKPGNTLGKDGTGRLVFRLWGRLIFAREVTIPGSHYMAAATVEGGPRAVEAVKRALTNHLAT